ncbi:MAG TPA: 50S ribosomal protein L3 [Rhizomicrobium sp.]|nr:50S ribosomal protein L3 [Rhizomicrobium sp.]
MINGLIGKKLGMTQIADPTGKVFAVTVVQLGPCTVTQIKTDGTDGYDAVQVTFGKKKLTRVNSAARGHFAKSEIAPGVKTIEFGKRGEGELKLGQPIAIADVFKIGDIVDVSATSKGRGYQGVMKRHHFKGNPASRGTHEYFRHGGSIGNRSYPGRVRKGMRMAGQMGNVKATVLNLKILDVLPDDHAVLISGAVPGADGAIVLVHHAARSKTRSVQVAANG